MSDLMRIAMWPDGMWCPLGEVAMYSWMSDDYEILEVPADFDG